MPAVLASRPITAGALTLALLALAACTPGSGAPGPSPAPTASAGPAASAGPDAGIVALGELLDDDGVLPLDLAQRIFAEEVAPLPGVEPLYLADGDTVHDLGGLAVRRVLGARADLPADVAAAAVAALEPEAGEEESVVEPGRSREGAGGVVDPDQVPSAEELREIVAGVIAGLEERTGHDLRLQVRARTVRAGVMTDLGRATSVYTGDRATACRVALNPAIYGPDEDSTLSTIAHEVWHCFQLDADARAYETAPVWQIEGQAEWAGEAYTGGSASSAGSWDTWLFLPEQALTRRSYDAIGLYAVAEAAGADPWQTMLPMLGQGATPGVQTLFGGRAAADAVRAQAMSLVRFPDLGPEWESTGPGITDTRTELVLRVDEAVPGEMGLTVGRFGTMPVRILATDVPILAVGLQGGTAGALEFPGTGTVPLPPGGAVRLCTDAAACVCPDGTTPPGLLPAGPGPGVAAVGSVDGGDVLVRAEGVSLEDACNGGLVGTWTAEYDDVVSALRPDAGGSPMECDGDYTMTFAQDLTWSGGYDATCSLFERSGRATVAFTATYTDDGSTFVLLGIVGDGTLTMEGVSMPLPGVEQIAAAFSQPVSYVLDGDTLVVSYSTPDGGAAQVTYTRSA